jgi:hypothetical protein
MMTVGDIEKLLHHEQGEEERSSSDGENEDREPSSEGEDSYLESLETRESRAALETRRVQAAQAREWDKEVREAAIEDQERRWAEEQKAYRPQDPRLGRGDAALWCHLHPPVGGKIERSRWGLLHLLRFKELEHDDAEAFLRLVTGSTTSSRAQRCKRRAVHQWKHPRLFTDADKMEAVRCPCGVGPQDSLHVLECKHAEIERVRQRVLQVADRIMHVSNRPKECFTGEGKKKKAHDGANAENSKKLNAQRKRHEDAVDAWAGWTDTQKLCLTLGSTPTGVHDALRSKLITKCATEWARIEDAWERMEGK